MKTNIIDNSSFNGNYSKLYAKLKAHKKCQHVLTQKLGDLPKEVSYGTDIFASKKNLTTKSNLSAPFFIGILKLFC
ncbi:MAG: hypothetical protein MJ180_01840 [Candidatus Gastranaerophilales bacterium]|nr:hypothetical protein [Candidatus Gastranaerophilales bacterium]